MNISTSVDITTSIKVTTSINITAIKVELPIDVTKAKSQHE